MNQVVYINKINKASEKFEQLHGRKPTLNELEEVTNIDSDKISLTLASANRAISLESPIKDEDASCLLDIIPDDTQAPTDSYTARNDLSEGVERVLAKLSYRDRDIIRMSFGIGMQPMPNEEIAKRFGIGSERVRQIQHSTISFIRKNHLNELKELL